MGMDLFLDITYDGREWNCIGPRQEESNKSQLKYLTKFKRRRKIAPPQMTEWSEGYENEKYGHPNINLVVFFGCCENLQTE